MSSCYSATFPHYDILWCGLLGAMEGYGASVPGLWTAIIAWHEAMTGYHGYLGYGALPRDSDSLQNPGFVVVTQRNPSITFPALQLHARLLFDKNRPQFNVDVVLTHVYAFNSIITLLQGYSLHLPLADLVRKTPALVDLIIKLRALEIRDAEIVSALDAQFPSGFVIPPGASISRNRYAFTLGDGPESTMKWGPLFSAALGGTLAENAYLILAHIDASLARSSSSQKGTDLESTTTLLKCYYWLDDITLKSWTQFLCEELPKYMIYISVLRPTNKSFASIKSLGLAKHLRCVAADS
ncbi:hypothetical protein B0H19DRAFT_1070226 [Mycena capillaripes]|nr:hypothetical protein B0H19DRAFT_1070226 [Mycena capillaripes]